MLFEPFVGVGFLILGGGAPEKVGTAVIVMVVVVGMVFDCCSVGVGNVCQRW